MMSHFYYPISTHTKDVPHVGSQAWLVRCGKLLFELWLAAFGRSRGSWARVSVGSLCVVLEKILGKTIASGWHVGTKLFTIKHLKQTNGDWANRPTTGFLRILNNRDPSLNRVLTGKNIFQSIVGAALLGLGLYAAQPTTDSQPAPRIRSRVEDFDDSSAWGITAVFTFVERDLMETKG